MRGVITLIADTCSYLAAVKNVHEQRSKRNGDRKDGRGQQHLVQHQAALLALVRAVPVHPVDFPMNYWEHHWSKMALLFFLPGARISLCDKDRERKRKETRLAQRLIVQLHVQ